MGCTGTQYSIPQMLEMARQSGYSGVGQVEIVAHALVESGGCDRAYNAGSGAAGILQFLPSTAAGVGLANPYNAQASFDASFRLSGGTNFADWTPYEPASDLQAALQRVRDASGSRPASAPASGLTAPGTGLVAGKAMDPFGIGQAIADSTGHLGATLHGAGMGFQSAGQIAAGLVVAAAGVGLVAWLLLTRTPAGQEIVRAGKRTTEAALTVAAAAPK